MVEGTLSETLSDANARQPEVFRTRLLLIAIAIWVASSDLTVKWIEPTEAGLYHRRTGFELFLILAISAATAYFVPLARSAAIAIGAGLMVGGGVGNALSIAIFDPGVPNPFTVSQGGWIIAFNLADVAVATGFVLMTVGVWGLASERKPDLNKPVER